MANARPRGSSTFSGLILIFIGVLLLLHNYRGLELGAVFGHWWPLMLIFWGALKLYERTAGPRTREPGSARITPGEVFLVLGLLALVGIVVGTEKIKDKIGDDWGIDIGRESFSSDLDVAPMEVPKDARITIRNLRGDVVVRSSNNAEIRVNGKKSVHGWNQTEAERLASHVTVEVVKNGDGYEIHPTGTDSRVKVDMDVVVPEKSNLAIHSEKGDVTISDMATPVTIDGVNGDIEVRGTNGDVAIDMRHGDAKISDTKGNVKLSGNGDSVEVIGASGSLTVNGEFVGPIRAEKIAKGVRFVSHRTDLTVTQLTGHMEAGSGNLEVVDAPGNLNVKTHEEEISIENAGGRIKVDNRNGNVEVRFSFPPKDDVEIYNSSAGITLGMPESSSFQITADCHSGDIDSEFEGEGLKKTSTESGDSHLEGKYGNGRGPKIILKTSYGSIAIHKTT